MILHLKLITTETLKACIIDEFSLGSNFGGVIISKDGVFITSGGTINKLKNVSDFFPNKESAPFY